jgi:hypothetical protein
MSSLIAAGLGLIVTAAMAPAAVPLLMSTFGTVVPGVGTIFSGSSGALIALIQSGQLSSLLGGVGIVTAGMGAGINTT